MSKILKGPISIEQVANFIDSITKTFYHQIGHGTRISTNIGFWSSDQIIYPNPDIDPGLNGLYEQIHRMNLSEKLKTVASQFAVAVNVYGYNSEGSKWFGPDDMTLEIKTRIFDKTLLEDLCKGQIFPAIEKEFIITSWNYTVDGTHKNIEIPNIEIPQQTTSESKQMTEIHTNFIHYRDQRITEAQQRINPHRAQKSFDFLI
ncbi:hypothetical protein HY837_00130 [archaeon]|nr:hypothetical protein [archaeon]